MSRWRRFRNLPAPERGMLLHSLAALPLSALLLRLAGFRRAQGFLSKTAGRRARPLVLEKPELPQAQRAARLVAAAAAEGLYRANCLEQSLTLWWLLQRRGVACQLRIGVRKQAERLEAHAWVEFDGAILNDGEGIHRHFSPFPADLATSFQEQR
jgi:hypothetical protein